MIRPAGIWSPPQGLARTARASAPASPSGNAPPPGTPRPSLLGGAAPGARTEGREGAAGADPGLGPSAGAPGEPSAGGAAGGAGRAGPGRAAPIAQAQPLGAARLGGARRSRSPGPGSLSACAAGVGSAMSSPKNGFYRQEITKTLWEVRDRYRDLQPVGSGAYGAVW